MANEDFEYWKMILKTYLERYKKCIKAMNSLRERIALVQEYRESPLRSCNNDNAGGGKSNLPGDPTPTIALESDALTKRLKIQTNKNFETMENITKILEQLEQGADEREVLEHKYLNLETEADTCAKLSISRSKYYTDLNKGLYELISKHDVIKELSKYVNDQEGNPGERKN